MMNAKVFQRLAWKDARILAPLPIAVAIAIVVFNLMLLLVVGSSRMDVTARWGIAQSIWILLPMLLAYGAPALLIGGEEESGSLAWLRCLPADWLSVSMSKLVVAAAALGMTWILASIGLMIQWLALSDSQIELLRRSHNLAEPFSLYALMVVAVSLMFLFCSFICAYLFRSPITALLAVMPAIAIVVTSFGWATDRVLGPDRSSPIGLLSDAQRWAMVGLAIITALLIFVINQLAARHRLTGPEVNRIRKLPKRPPANAYHPPRAASWYGSSLSFGRPSKFAAMLWMAVHPIRWPLAILLLLVVVAAVKIFSANEAGIDRPGVFLAVSLISTSLLTIGSITFYSDSVRQRCQYLSDRGISPTLVWWTRLLPTLTATLLALLAIIVVVATIGSTNDSFGRSGLIAAVLFSFAVGQLVSQWSPRPILAFFAAPVFVSLSFFALALLFEFYQKSAWVLLFSVPVLLVGSWHLTPRWMRGDVDRAYVNRFIAYMVAAVLLPYVLILGFRWLTTPPERSQWRNEMFATELASPASDRAPMQILASAEHHVWRESGTSDWTRFDDRLEAELADERALGEHVMISELAGWLRRTWRPLEAPPGSAAPSATSAADSSHSSEEGDTRRDLLALRVLRKWARETRQQAIAGKADFNRLWTIAEAADAIAAPAIQSRLNSEELDAEEILAGDLLPDPTLTQRARRAALIGEWRRYQTDDNLPKRFASMVSTAPTAWWLGVERRRASRFLDQAVELILSRWDSGRDVRSPQTIAALESLLARAYLRNDPRRPTPRLTEPSDGFSAQLVQMATTDQLFNQIRSRISSKQPTGGDGS
ncbi:hypothetical protein FYK55_00210 [Roseiconus nitratireducens]|uniref:ABC-2 family transporter protein n=1 Tax=Roseiconus nitratireducens TaxID=2605748 RepID=A0A5M6DH89_9BACT|nr:hypothetical protein [Roseiconus nitratireducens]KAA5546891.1 hypothetical protein FYK55_00210 [Roseiconus nitratireducens]